MLAGLIHVINKAKFYFFSKNIWNLFALSLPEMLLAKVVLKISRKLTREHPCWSVISINLLCNFTEITLRPGCFPINLLHIFRTPFYKNNSGGLFCTCMKIALIRSFFWSVLPVFGLTKDIYSVLSKSPYLVQIKENTGIKNPSLDTFHTALLSFTQPAFTCSNSITETLEQYVKSVVYIVNFE